MCGVSFERLNGDWRKVPILSGWSRRNQTIAVVEQQGDRRQVEAGACVARDRDIARLRADVGSHRWQIRRRTDQARTATSDSSLAKHHCLCVIEEDPSLGIPADSAPQYR